MQSHAKHLNASEQLSRWTAISSFALIAATWRLWTPQTLYPQVPAFEFLCNAPHWLDWIGLSGTLVGLVLLALNSGRRFVQCGCATTLVSLTLLFSLDQHRFQPWAYELWLFCAIWLGCRDPLRMKLMRWLLISIYFYSAVGKLDFEFMHTVGQQMLGAVVGGLGIDPKDLSPGFRLAVAATFPFCELIVALGLAFPKTRRLAGWLAIAVHLGLIVILGPLGLNHRLGVLCWNAQVAVQAYWLFVFNQPEVDAAKSLKQAFAWPMWSAMTLVAAAIALPSTERFGLWDHWPSWALYAPHSSRVHLEIAAPAVGRLPEDLRKLVQASDPEEFVLWLTVPIDAWSLEALNTPIYPQARFQLGVAEKVASTIGTGDQVRITMLGTASRFTGKRSASVLVGLPQLTNSRQNFWLNHHPRNEVKTP